MAEKKYIVFEDKQYYPCLIGEYETLKDAQKIYEENNIDIDNKVYLCRIIKFKKWLKD